MGCAGLLIPTPTSKCQGETERNVKHDVKTRYFLLVTPILNESEIPEYERAEVIHTIPYHDHLDKRTYHVYNNVFCSKSVFFNLITNKYAIQ